MDNVVHDDAAVLSNVLDQLNEVADKQQSSATSGFQHEDVRLHDDKSEPDWS